AVGVFPVFLKSTLGDENSFTVFDGGASEYGLTIGLLWWPVSLVLTLGYVRFLAHHFGGKLGDSQHYQQDQTTPEELTMEPVSATTAGEPRIIIVGGGFGGLAAARALRKASARVLLIDKTNHQVFQPLLYQVATSILSPEHVGAPIRHVLRRHANMTVIQGTVTVVDVAKRV